MKVIIAPDPHLRVETKPVKKITPHLLKTAKEMVKLARSFKDPEGVGLAATQIGESEQYFIFKLKDGRFKAFFNPRILKYSKRNKLFLEGCLSIPNYWGEIKRPVAITVSYLDVSGNNMVEKLTGLQSWFFQHEYDHIQGKLFMDRVLEQKSRLFKVVGTDRAGAEIFEQVAL